MDVRINKDWFEALSSSAPVPGGGGASALAGAGGAALCVMVANLTVGKKKYAEHEELMKEFLVRLEKLRDESLTLIEEDAKGFEPLAAAYSLPSSTDEEKAEKEKIMAQALLKACEVPIMIMEKGAEILEIAEELAEKGSVMAVSDVGVAVQFIRTAVLGASMNVYINTKSMKDRKTAEELNAKADSLNKKASETADAVFAKIEGELKCR